MSRRGSQSAILLNFPSLHTQCAVFTDRGLPEFCRRCCHHWDRCAKDLFSPVSEMHISLRIGLAGRQGVSATTGAQVGFAKRLITKPRFVPTKPHGCPSELPFTWCLELGVSCNYCLAATAVLPLDPPLSTWEALLPRRRSSLQGPAGLCSSPTLMVTPPVDI